MSKIEKVCVIGTGVLAIKCSEYALKKGMSVKLYDMGQKPSVFMKKQAEAKTVPYFYESPEDVFEQLGKEDEPLLLVSAINERIVPKSIFENKNIKAVNLHQALLPAHPGRNAEAWAIYEQDEYAGITWHEMTQKVDGGGIYIQKKIQLNENITSYILFKNQIECAYEAFVEIFNGLIDGSLKPVPQQLAEANKFHYSKDVPNNGILDSNWDFDKISAFLRAMDYAGLPVFSKPRLIYQGREYQWKKYEILKVQDNPENENISNEPECGLIQISKEDIVIQKKTGKILLKKYTIMEEKQHGEIDEHFKGVKTGD